MVEFSPAGDAAVLVCAPHARDGEASRYVFRLFESLRRAPPAGFVAAIPAFRTLLVQFDPLATDLDLVQNYVQELAQKLSRSSPPKARHWNVPVCYEGSHGPDLARVAASAGMSVHDYARRHCAQPYYVYMLGGFPGFPYLGDVPEALQAARLSKPRLEVPAGSVGIAGHLTCIYPMSTPGGWNLIGRSPLVIFDARRKDPALIGPGDTVAFEPISCDEYDAFHQASQGGESAGGKTQ
jgi:inhibitor of KinA